MTNYSEPVEDRKIHRGFRWLGLCWTAVLLLLACWSAWQTYSATWGSARASAEESLHKDVIYRRWASIHGGIYVPVTDQTPPNPDLADSQERDVVTPSGRLLTLINPAYMNRQAHEIGNKENGSRGHITSLTPLRAANAADAWESQALQSFQRGEKDSAALDEIEGQTYFRLMRPLVTEPACIKCHAKQGYQVADVRGGISASIPWKPYRDALRSQLMTNLGGSFCIWLLGMLGLLGVRRSLLDSLRERQQAQAALQVTNAELKAANRQLAQSQGQLLQSEKMAAVGQLAAGVAHEINNPIGFVSSNLSSLSRYVQDLLGLVHAYEEQARERPDLLPNQALRDARVMADVAFLKEDIPKLLKESVDGLLRVKHIVQDLKDFSRVDSLQWQETDLMAGLESTLNVVRNELNNKAEIVKNYAQLPLVYCNPAQINQVFLNLLMNAVQSIENQGRITLSSGVEADRVWISIEDTGAGIAPEHLHRIFEPFFTTKPVGKGTGLGLSITYDIVKQHGGEITVTSEPGIGTRFCVWLPKRNEVV
jgi:two-component system NtrC family sensor kinase